MESSIHGKQHFKGCSIDEKQHFKGKQKLKTILISRPANQNDSLAILHMLRKEAFVISTTFSQFRRQASSEGRW